VQGSGFIQVLLIFHYHYVSVHHPSPRECMQYNFVPTKTSSPQLKHLANIGDLRMQVVKY